VTALWHRVRALGPAALDRALAGMLFVFAQIELLGQPDLSAPLWICMIGVAGFTVPLAWRRRRPLLVELIGFASVILMRVLLIDPTDMLIPFVAALTVSYSVGANTDGRTAWLGLAVAVAGIGTVALLADNAVAGDYIFPPAFGVIMWLGGRAVRTRTRLTEELHEAAVLEEEAHEREVAAAAAGERRRIAREMHDVVAHSVSVMVVQAGGARRILDRDPARAVAAAEQIERTGREALAEMRRLLGVLHAGEDVAVLAPQPTLAAADDLIERAREAGLFVELRVEGEPRALPAGLDLAAFRVVQEGVTNALKYADGEPTDVTLRWHPARLEIEIADRGPGPSERHAAERGGQGLVGMRERVRLYGGEMQTGRRSGGGFRVHVTLPLAEQPAEAEAAA
jgi:signal transduction histidine kinase